MGPRLSLVALAVAAGTTIRFALSRVSASFVPAVLMMAVASAVSVAADRPVSVDAVADGAESVTRTRFDSVFQTAREQLASGQVRQGLAACRGLLEREGRAPGVTVVMRGQVHREILRYALSLPGDSAETQGSIGVTYGNLAAKAILREEQAAYGAGSIDRLSGMVDVANWYLESGQFGRQRDAAREAVALVDAVAGPTSESLAVPLWLLGMSYVLERRQLAAARAVFERGLSLQLGDSVSGARNRSELHAGLGDVAVLQGTPEQISGHYGAAWQALASHRELGVSAANQTYALPVPLDFDPPSLPRYSLAIDNGLIGTAPGQTRLRVRYSVDPDGRTGDVVVLLQDVPGGSTPGSIRNAMARARFRPAVRDGVPVVTRDQVIDIRMDAADR
jgi:hypothetical protein